MLRPWPNWNINIFNAKPLKNSILLGVGCGVNSKSVNWYTKLLYKMVLSKDIEHSVRDNKAKEMLENMGFKAINTGCATLWKLSEELCKEIPTKKYIHLFIIVKNLHLQFFVQISYYRQ